MNIKDNILILYAYIYAYIYNTLLGSKQFYWGNKAA